MKTRKYAAPAVKELSVAMTSGVFLSPYCHSMSMQKAKYDYNLTFCCFDFEYVALTETIDPRTILCLPSQPLDIVVSMLCPWARHLSLLCFASLRCKLLPRRTAIAMCAIRFYRRNGCRTVCSKKGVDSALQSFVCAIRTQHYFFMIIT